MSAFGIAVLHYQQAVLGLRDRLMDLQEPMSKEEWDERQQIIDRLQKRCATLAGDDMPAALPRTECKGHCARAVRHRVHGRPATRTSAPAWTRTSQSYRS